MRKRIAYLTSQVLNPFLISLALVILLSFYATSGTITALKWSLIFIAISILPVFSAILYFTHHGSLDSFFTNIRRQRTKVYLVSCTCASISCIILYYLGAPVMLLAISVTGLSGAVVFMGINLWWKISLHTAFVAASVTVLVILFGPVAAIAIILLPLIIWARIELEHHSLAQAATGAILSASIVVLIFYLFGLI